VARRRWARQRLGENLYLRTDGEMTVFEAHFRDVDGRQRCRKLAARTERAARKELRALLARRDAGERVKPADLTLRAFVESEYGPLLDSLAAAGRRAEQGVKLDKDHLRLYLLPALGDRKLSAIEASHVAAMLRDLRGRKRDGKRGLSESSLRHSLTVLRAIFRLARSRRIVTRSPLDDLDPGELPRPATRAAHGRRLDERELDTLVRHATDGYRVAVALLAYTGMRISEACALRWQDIDFVDRELHVRGQLTRATRSKPARIVARKGGAGPFTAVLFPTLETILVDHLRDEQLARRGRDRDFVLCTRTGRPIAQFNLAHAVADAASSAGLGKVTPHDLRRSFCSLAARRGVDPVQAARMTGHSLDVWTRHYAGDYGKAQRDEARERMLAAGFGADIALTWEAPAKGRPRRRKRKPAVTSGFPIGAGRFELPTSSPPD
jgi:integrase